MTSKKYPQNLRNFAFPYLFALKAGEDIAQNSLDYSLMMLQVSCPEVIRSPKTSWIPPKQKTSDKKNLNSLKKIVSIQKDQLAK